MLLPRRTKSESNIATFHTRRSSFLRFQLSKNVQSNVAPAPILILDIFTVKLTNVFWRDFLSSSFETLPLTKFNFEQSNSKWPNENVTFLQYCADYTFYLSLLFKYTAYLGSIPAVPNLFLHRAKILVKKWWRANIALKNLNTGKMCLTKAIMAQ